MGQKVNPHGLRVGIIKNWDSRWFANDSVFGDTLVEDYNLRKYLKTALAAATTELQKQWALKKSILELEGRKARSAFQLEFTERGGKGKLGDYSGQKLLSVEKNGKMSYQNMINNLKGRMDMYDVFEMQNRKGFNGVTSYNGKEYTRKQRDAFLKQQKQNREAYGNLQALDKVVQNNPQIVSDYLTALSSGQELETFMNEQQKILDRTLKRIGNGSSGGGSRGGRNNHRGTNNRNNQRVETPEEIAAEMEISVDKETFEAACAKAYRKNVGKIAINGFSLTNISRKQIIQQVFSGTDALNYEQLLLDCNAERLSRTNGRKIGF